MKISADKRLFWFLKDNTELDLDSPAILDMYVQQVLMYGKAQDIKSLFKKIGFIKFKQSFERIKPFLSEEVRRFWEDFLGNT